MKHQIKAFLIENYETADAKQLREDHGVRIRQTKSTKSFGDDVIEFATTYFYTSQASTLSLVARFANYTGLTPQFISWYDGTPREANKNALKFETKSWPKDSWAIAFVRFS